MAETDRAAGSVVALARRWAAADPDPETRAEALELADRVERGDAAALSDLSDAFSGRLAFGTAGLRGRLGAGPRRMNRVVVAQTSAGFAAYLLERAARGEASSPPSIVIGYDGRVNSDVFARDAAEIMAGRGVRVTLAPHAFPTPATAFAVRHLGVSAGVMVTASHNPPRDNGYKVYLGDADGGSQIIPPDDARIAAHIEAAAEHSLADHPRSDDYAVAGPELLDAYVSATARAVGTDLAVRSDTDPPPLRIAYTALHGVGSEPARRLFEALGLPEIVPVPEQDRPDGSFPTVSFPNPEEPGAMDLVYRTADEIGADLVVAHDPDADRLAIALPVPAAERTAVDRAADPSARYRRLTGNQLGLLLGWRAAERHRRTRGDAPGALACTIVSSPALRAVAAATGLGYAETLSGFKWVSRVPDLVFGFEEALGYLTHPDVVHDKDGISASADTILMVRELAAEGRTVWDLLDEATERFGHFASAQVTVRLDTMKAVGRLAELVRGDPPAAFGDVPVVETKDLLTPGVAEVPADVLRYDLADGSRIMIRPSGTEPKLKVYLDTFSDSGDVAGRRHAAERALERLETAVRGFLDRARGEEIGS